MSVRLLAISADPTIYQADGYGAMGDSYQRQVKYASIVKEYHIIVRTLRRNGLLPVRLAENCWVYPTCSRSRVSFLRDAVRVGSAICRDNRIQVVSTQDPFATALAGYALKRKYGIPLSVQFAGDMVDNAFWLSEGALNRLQNQLGKWLIKRADTFRVVSNREKEKLMKLGVPEERVFNVGWITDFSPFLTADGSGIRTRLLEGGRYERLILFAGRLVPQKDLDTLLDAVPLVLASHPGARFVLVGGGELEPRLRERAFQRGLERSVVFEGERNYGEIPHYFAACDVFALSSVYEGNARVLAEAAAAGKPVVATDVSGTTDTVIEGITGHIVPPRNACALAEKLSALLANPAGMVAMGKEARNHIGRLYDTQRLLDGFRELWNKTAELV